MTPNVPLLKKTLQHIEKHPEVWEQRAFRCGTQFCFAGHAALLAGSKLVHPADEYDIYVKADRARRWPKESLRTRALRVLRLDDDQGDRLFYDLNSMERLRRIVGKLIEGAKR